MTFLRRIFVGLGSAALVVAPSAALAHGGHGSASTFNLPLLIGGVIVLGAGIALRSSNRGPVWLPSTVLTVGIVAAAAAFVMPRIDHPETQATIRLVTPINNEVVPAGEPVRVEVEVSGGPVATSPEDTEGGHIHLYVDDEIQTMPSGTVARLAFTEGRHLLKAEYVDAQHASFVPPVQTTVQIVAE